MFLVNVRPSKLKPVLPAANLKVLKERESALTRLLMFHLGAIEPAGLGCQRMGDDRQAVF